MRPIGLDFGTTNSAIAVAESHGEVRLARYRGNLTTFRSILYFERDEARAQTQVFAGPEAIARYLAGDGTGRLIQSIKSHLASRLFERTSIFGRAWELPDLLSALLERLFREAEADLGELPRRRAVVGRPVHFASAESEADETLALERLRAALAR
ncbi:MAG: Hsp70 family protein, partial [Polyangiales bacterium]